MNRVFWLSFGGMVVAALGAGCYAAFTPKLGHATRAQIEAAIPASLKVVEPSDPVAEARYERLVVVVARLKGFRLEDAEGSRFARLGAPGYKAPDPAARRRLVEEGRPVVDEVARLLAGGGVRPPLRRLDTAYPQDYWFRMTARLLALKALEAASRGDRPACARAVLLGLRFGRALKAGGGVIFDGRTAAACEGHAFRAAYDAEMAGGLDARGREAVLAALPARQGPDPAMAGRLRRDFQETILPYLAEPKRLIPVIGDTDDHPFAGTLNPVASARLLGRVYDAALADAMRPPYAQSGLAERLSDEAAERLPDSMRTGGVDGLWNRALLNLGPNTLGRALAASGPGYARLAVLDARGRAGANLARAVILLRSSRSVDLPDPFAKGKLRIDPKRRVVWSVGENGVDDGGDIRQISVSHGDLGYKY